MKINKRYKNLFRLSTRYCIITGGRGSGKSFALSVALLMRTFQEGKTILFTRYTMTSAEISIIPEFWEKVEMLGLEEQFTRTANSITNIQTGSTILFRGLKASSGKQTANLKSINNITTWVLDEAEEMTDEDMFDKIDLSVRKRGEANEVILVLNPPSIKHMIYRKFFKERGVYDVCNKVKDDCTYIHTTYLDNLKNLDKTFLEIAEKAKADEDRYNNIFLGKWATQAEGLVFKNWRSIPDKDYPIGLPCWYGTDWGFANDPTGIVRICFDKEKMALYLHEVCYQKSILNNEIALKIKNDFRDKKTLLYQDEKTEAYVENKTIFVNGVGVPLFDDTQIDPVGTNALKVIRDVLTEVYCDPSRPEHIRELRQYYALSALPAINMDKVGRIEFLKYFNVFYTESSSNIANEVQGYKWLTNKEDSRTFQNKPQDGDDHLIDATLYGAVTHLRRIGVANLMGEK